MWGSGVNNEPDRVYYSAAFDPQDFTTPEHSGFIDIPTFDGGSIVAVQTIFNDVVVFKSENVFRVFGTYPGTYQVDKLYGIVGPVAPNSIVSTGTRVFFLSKQGLCVYDGNQVVPFASLKIKNILNRINPAYVKHACAKYYQDIYYLALPLDDSGVNNAVIEFDTVKNTFMLRHGLRVDSFLEFDDKLLISNGTKNIFEYNKGDTYGGEPISAFWETPFLDFGAAGRKKELKLFETHAEGEALKIAAYIDNKYKEKTISLCKSINYKRSRLSGKGRRIKFRFENTQGSNFEMLPPEITVNIDK